MLRDEKHISAVPHHYAESETNLGLHSTSVWCIDKTVHTTRTVARLENSLLKEGTYPRASSSLSSSLDELDEWTLALSSADLGSFELNNMKVAAKW